MVTIGRPPTLRDSAREATRLGLQVGIMLGLGIGVPLVAITFFLLALEALGLIGPLP